MNKETYSLYELNALVRLTIEAELTNEYWVEAELSEVRESRGHCYMELVQKEEQTNTPIARASAKCWRSTWSMVEPYFLRTTGQALRAGMKVRLKVYPQFHEAFGFSWIVTDVDATYTLGDMAKRRQDIIRQLKEEGVFDLQKSLRLPLFCQHIAVISSETAAGYGDFSAQLRDNEYGFHFSTRLFPAIMQGEQVEQSIIAALDSIYRQIDNYDCVAIIRGGGATADMSGFDTLALAENVAQFPIPIITGIGHDRDECVLDMVSHTRVKTPTAAAALLIDNLKQVLDTLTDAQQRITRYTQLKLSTLKAQLGNLQSSLPHLLTVIMTRQHTRIDTLAQRIPLLADRRLTQEKHRLELMSEKVKMLDPSLLLKRGYSITLKDGHVVKDARQVQTGDEIETRLSKGTIKSIIQ
ncbi:MAG: exodeoxyribonuclease VII large subunit [Prevotella sp.]|nr:exodeoxyribonuclease VII large subunit [Prevotella sp.]